MSAGRDSLLAEMEAAANSIRWLAASGGGDGRELRRLVGELLSAFPRRIRGLPSGRRDAMRQWQTLVLTIDPRRLPFAARLRMRACRWRLNRLPRIVETLAYCLGVMAVFRRLNRGAKRVLTFHNVMPDRLCACDMASGVTMSASQFGRLVRRLASRYRFSADFDDPSTLTATFDDGYRCQFETAGEVLEGLGVPAVVFVSGDVWSADSPARALVVDRLLYWTSYAPMSALSAFAGSEVSSRAEFWHEFMNPAYRRDAAGRGENVFSRANELWPFSKVVESLDPEMVRLRLTGPDVALVERLKGAGWRVGWHTKTHFPLACLPDADAEAELSPPDPACLELPMSFPYGEPGAVSLRDEGIAREKGFPGALSNLSYANDREGDFFMLRFTPTGDRIGDESMLSGFRYFMECGRLLRRAARSNNAQGRQRR